MQCIIAYDLKKPGQKYDLLYWSLEQIGACRAQGSVWFYGGAMTPADIVEILRRTIDANDDLMIVECGGRWATVNSWAALAWLSTRDVFGRIMAKLT